jgi:endonuclease/exonuclease/phosphatase family metal-dependent hydrolase
MIVVYKELVKLDLPFIIAGDFNEEPNKASTTYLDAMATSAYDKVPYH